MWCRLTMLQLQGTWLCYCVMAAWGCAGVSCVVRAEQHPAFGCAAHDAPWWFDTSQKPFKTLNPNPPKRPVVCVAGLLTMGSILLTFGDLTDGCCPPGRRQPASA